jgi:cytochrome c oxidase assembly protein subunit 15
VFKIHITPRTYARITLISLIALALIVISGGAVRLTGSGLGCPDWPACTSSQLIAPLQYHAMIEFVNRVITGLVSVSVIVAVLASFMLQPRRRDLIWLSIGLVAGVVGQIILGGLTVLYDLNPAFVASHFVLSLVIVADAVVLFFRSRDAATGSDPVKRFTGSDPVNLRGFSKLMVVATTLVILLGTVVTGSGPHGGDEHAKRFDFIIGDVARMHGISVMILLAITLYVAWLIRRNTPLHFMSKPIEILLLVMVAQAAVGYTQYFTGVPAFLVGIHIAGAVSVWIGVWWFALTAHARLAPVETRVTSSAGIARSIASSQ